MRMRNDPSTDPSSSYFVRPRRRRRRRAARESATQATSSSSPTAVAARKPRAHLLLRRGRLSIAKAASLWSARDVEERGLTVVPHEPVARLDVAKRTVASESGRTWRASQRAS